MKTLLLLLTMPLFAHVPCKQWEVIDTTINGKVRQISYCPEWDNKAPCEPLTLVKVRRDTITITDTIWLQPVALERTEYSGDILCIDDPVCIALLSLVFIALIAFIGYYTYLFANIKK